MVALARTAGDDAGPERLLELLVDVAAEYLASDGVGLMVHDGGRLRFAHSAGGDIATAERLQELTREGPCHDACCSRPRSSWTTCGTPCRPPGRRTCSGRSPEGFGSVVAVPLVGRRAGVGGAGPVPPRGRNLAAGGAAVGPAAGAHGGVVRVMATDRDAARSAQGELAHPSTHDALTGTAQPGPALRPPRARAAHRRASAAPSRSCSSTSTASRPSTTPSATPPATRCWPPSPPGWAPSCASGHPGPPRRGRVRAGLRGPAGGCGGGPRRPRRALTARLQRVLAQPIPWGAEPRRLRQRRGGLQRPSGPNADDLLAEADGAMYRAKQHPPRALARRLRRPGRARRRRGAAPRAARRLERQLGEALAGAGWRSTTSPSRTRPAPCTRSRPSCAGPTRSSGCCPRRSSSTWPSPAASSSASGTGSSPWPAPRRPAGSASSVRRRRAPPTSTSAPRSWSTRR